ncbi:hypothetical protein [Actinoplanes sp. M2I2]|uniref:hypothetical protein n=1 Tax=Actinoplanes sp. M2I2 TaxID=1734444 RepID=UPI0020220944|nr:hypothetical protein [Actinoplanes sp. M2I2]
MPSNTTPAAPVTTEVDRLRAENEKLQGELADARANAVVQPNTTPTPREPKFGLSEGQRADLELHGKTVSPFTGARQVGDGEPGTAPRVVDQDTFEKVPDKATGAAPDPLVK